MQMAKARSGPLALCVAGTLIAGGVSYFLVVDGPGSLAEFGRLVAVMNSGMLAYYLGVVAYCRRVDRERNDQAEAAAAERLRFYQDRAIEMEATLAALASAARGAARERQVQLETERRNTNLLQAIDKKIDRQADRRPRRRVNRSDSANHTRQPPPEPSITDELRAYLAGRESLDDGRL
jgi:hypothetical protein